MSPCLHAASDFWRKRIIHRVSTATSRADFSGTEPNVTFTATGDFSSPPLRNGIWLDLPNGIMISPGVFPLYRNGVLIGAIGVSGDGVDQDNIVGVSGTHDFLAPCAIRSDQFNFRGTRLPYANSSAIRACKINIVRFTRA